MNRFERVSESLALRTQKGRLEIAYSSLEQAIETIAPGAGRLKSMALSELEKSFLLCVRHMEENSVLNSRKKEPS